MRERGERTGRAAGLGPVQLRLAERFHGDSSDVDDINKRRAGTTCSRRRPSTREPTFPVAPVRSTVTRSG